MNKLTSVLMVLYFLSFPSVSYAQSSQILFSSYFGGANSDGIRDIAVDSQGYIYIAGGTESPSSYNNPQGTFPTTSNAYQKALNLGTPETSSVSQSDVFAAKLTPDGRSIVWATYIGGPNHDRAYAIEVDSQGYVYLGGRAGRGFPATSGSFQTAFQGGQEASFYGNQDAFLAKLKPDGSQLIWASYFGTSDSRIIRDIDIDESGNIYLSSEKSAGTYPFQTTYVNSSSGGKDGVVAKVSPDGTKVLWLRYIGGTNNDGGTPSIRVDDNGNIYALMHTQSTDIPVTSSAFDPTFNAGGVDLHLNKISNDGKNLLYATYIGGNDVDFTETHGLALDGNDIAVIAATTRSSNIPTTPTAFQKSYAGAVTGGSNYNGDFFITKIDTTKSGSSSLIASTYLGGSNGEGLEGVDTDIYGNVYVSGGTYSSDFPVTADAFQNSTNGKLEAVTTVLSPDLNSLVYSTYLGGTTADVARSLVSDRKGKYFIAGEVNSTDFPTNNSLFKNFSGGVDGFFAGFLLSVDVSPTLSPPKPGDANGDGKVDRFDYVVWLKNFNQHVAGETSDGDFDKNGYVDGSDYVIWWQNFGS